MKQSIGPFLRRNWNSLSRLPFGKWLFSRLVGLVAPYSATIGANVQVLQPGHGEIILKEHRKVRNHLRSVHAIALANLAEMVTGLTLMNSLPPDARGILTGIQVSYHKKARGILKAQCDCDIPSTNDEREMKVHGSITDQQGVVVVTATASWLIGPAVKG